MLFNCGKRTGKGPGRGCETPVIGAEFYRLLLESDLLVMGTAEGQEEAQEQFPWRRQQI